MEIENSLFKRLPMRKEHLFFCLKTMTYQLESFWSEQTPQHEKETKTFENNIVETTLYYLAMLKFHEGFG